jgi:large subunit ribosomal protein L22
MSPRKVRLVIGLIRGQLAPAAVRQLEFAPQAAALPVLKLLKSAMANAEHNFQIDPATLRVAKITADGGPILHRYTQKAFGRGAPIRKRTVHIHIVLSDEPIVDVHKSAGKARVSSPVDSAKGMIKKAKKVKAVTAVATEAETPSKKKSAVKPRVAKTKK